MWAVGSCQACAAAFPGVCEPARQGSHTGVTVVWAARRRRLRGNTHMKLMILGLVLGASVALAQTDAGVIAPKAANPGDEVNPTLLRDLGNAGDDPIERGMDAGAEPTPFQQ